VKKTLVTCALPYANGMIHMGHLAGAYIPADVFSRFCRMRGDDLLFLCGSDEYGMAILLSAELAKTTPQEHVDFFHVINKNLFERLMISWNHFSRTTWSGHQAPVQQFFLDLLHNGYIEEKWSEQLYSSEEDRFLADRYVIGSCPKCGFDKARGDECPKCASSYEAIDLIHPRSKLSGAKLEKKSTKHWFLRLDLFKESLLQWLELKNWKPNVMNFVKAYIEDLRPRAITRDSHWGVPVPLEGAEGKVLYVWFDAPIGYVTAAMDWAQEQKDPELWKKFWLDEKTEFIQFLGKDNIPFHAVIFPSMVMGQNLPLKLVDKMPANEFYNLEGKKMSKSEGWSIDLADFLSRYDPESLRYMISATAPEASDSEFTWTDFQARVNSELVGKWANFIHRTLTFIQKIGGKIPIVSSYQESERVFIEELNRKLVEIYYAYENFKLRKSTQIMMEMAQICNLYFDTHKPWQLHKEMQGKRLDVVLNSCLEAIKLLAIAAHPLLPNKTELIWQMIGMKSLLKDLKWNTALDQSLEKGASLNVPQILFEKISDEQINLEKMHLQQQYEKAHRTADQVVNEPLVESCVNYDHLLSVDIRCVQIKEVYKVDRSKKLLRIIVDVGEGKTRQVISGIAEHYELEDLKNKKVACVVNLPIATIMGFQSEGLILTLVDGAKVKVIDLPQASLGVRIK
jgi:methionyl-tRNA synthetase